MDSTRETRGETTRAAGAQPVPITSALAVLVHTVVMLVHGAAHIRLNVELPAWANLYVLFIVGIGPIAGLSLLRASRQRTGALILFAAMIGALLFGVWKHFIAPGPDHIMHLQAGPWRFLFQVTAVLLAASEAAGAVVACMLLHALTRQPKAVAYEHNY